MAPIIKKFNTNTTKKISNPSWVINAGKSAYHALIPFYNNPYNNEPGKGLWRNGFERAKREWEIKNPRPKKEYDYDAA
jgi:hypothetical protein